MKEDLTFIQAVVGDYSDNGLATVKDDVTLLSLDGENEVMLEPIFDGDKEVGVRVITNENHVGDYIYKDKGFVEDFSSVMDAELNI